MGTCKTCRWWEEQHKLCHKQFADVINNKREFDSDSMRVSLGNAGGGVDTNEWWVHNVFTGPDFGCIHHQPIEIRGHRIGDVEIVRCGRYTSAIPKSAVCFFQEGNKIGCIRGDFTDLQNSPAGFGNTREEAAADLVRQEAMTPLEEVNQLRSQLQSASARIDEIVKACPHKTIRRKESYSNLYGWTWDDRCVDCDGFISCGQIPTREPPGPDREITLTSAGHSDNNSSGDLK